MNCIFTNALIFPMDSPAASPYRSLLVQDGLIGLLGSYQDCQAASQRKTETIDLQGRALLPAFTDTHTHFVELAKLRLQLNLAGCHTIAEYKERFTSYKQAFPQQQGWVLGGGWDQNVCDDPRSIRRQLLDEFFPSIPVALYSKDYHSRWCNSLALKLCGIDSESSDPAGGIIFRDAQGQPTGILSESAAEQVNKFSQEPASEQITQAIRASIQDIYRFGLTSLHSMESAASADLLEQIVRADASLRVCWHFPLDKLDEFKARGFRSYSGDQWFKLGGVKIFADGSLGSQTAATDHIYPGSAYNRGILRYEMQDLYELAESAARQGISCTVHAIGVRAVRTVIAVFLRLQEEQPGRKLLQRIEHLQSILPQDLARLKKSGAYCALQPVHLANDIDMIEEHWAPIQDCAYTFHSLQEAGIPFGFGSDAPIESINPFLGIYSAITRKKGLDPAQQSWKPLQLITAWDALQAYTLGAARGADNQRLLGSLAPGKLADLIVLEDFTREPAEYWLSARSLLTMLGGKIVHRDGL